MDSGEGGGRLCDDSPGKRRSNREQYGRRGIAVGGTLVQRLSGREVVGCTLRFW